MFAVGVEKMTDQFAGAIHPESTDIEGRGGLALPSLYTMAATRYQHLYGLTDADLAMVAEEDPATPASTNVHSTARHTP